MRYAKFQPSETAGNDHNYCASHMRLRRLMAEITEEVESIQYGHSMSVESRLQRPEPVNFYEEVSRFEIALIRAALHHCNGHQGNAALFLNMNSTTLNAKIKQYAITCHSYRTDSELKRSDFLEDPKATTPTYQAVGLDRLSE